MLLNARLYIETFSLAHACVLGDSLVVNYAGRCALREMIDGFWLLVACW